MLNFYRPLTEGINKSFVPVTQTRKSVASNRATAFVAGNRHAITDGGMPAGSYYYAPSPHYFEFWIRDFLFNIEHVSELVSAADIKTAVDWTLSKQIRNTTTSYTRNNSGGTDYYPLGTIADHIAPDGSPRYFAGGPGGYIGDKPTFDNHFCVITMAWHYGHRVGWSAGWITWFNSIATQLEQAFNAVPFNSGTNLVTAWGSYPLTSTWGFLDCIALTGDSISCSVLAYNAAGALAEMYLQAGDSTNSDLWDTKAGLIKSAIQAAFVTVTDTGDVPTIPGDYGYLPWTTSDGNGYRRSLDITGYAGWSGILTTEQLQQSARQIARVYVQDQAIGGTTNVQVFSFSGLFRGLARHSARSDDTVAGVDVWPLYVHRGAAGTYGTYLNGGHWYYQMAWMASCLVQGGLTSYAAEIFTNYLDDVAAGGALHPYERADYGTNAVNDQYMLCASVMEGATVVGSDVNIAPTSTISFSVIFDPPPPTPGESFTQLRMPTLPGGVNAPLRMRSGRTTLTFGFGGDGPIRIMTSEGVKVILQ